MNNAKSIITRLAVLAIFALAQLPMHSASIYGFILIDGIFYDIINGEAVVTYKMYDHSYYKGDIVIPQEIDYDGKTYTVTTIGEYAFYTGGTASNSVTSVTIPSTVTKIEERAFNGCSGLTEIILPEGLTSIGSSAFGSCSGLTQLTIPDAVTTIGEAAFKGCSNLTEITIGNSVTTIGRSAFGYCPKLTSITIPESVTWIGKWAFEGCTSVTTLNYNAIYCRDITWKDAWFNAFTDCHLTSITFGDRVQHIPAYLAKGQVWLKEVTIPNSVTLIGEEAFNDCGLLDVKLPDSLITIDNGAFMNCTGLSNSLIIPDAVTTIGNNAFDYCFRIKDLVIGRSVATIGEKAFSRCSGLASITIPGSVTTIGDRAFEGCQQLDSLTIGSGVTYIGGFILNECSKLKAVTSLAITPPTVADGFFVDIILDYEDVALHVRPESLDAYKSAFHWNQFLQIIGDAALTSPHDVNGDGEVTIADANSVVVIIINGGGSGHNHVPDGDGQFTSIADVNGDGEVNIADVNAIIDRILNNH